MSPHSGSEDAINSSSETSKDTTIAPPKVLVEEAPEDASISDASVADNKSTVSGSSMAIASNASYVMSLAILVLSVTILF